MRRFFCWILGIFFLSQSMVSFQAKAQSVFESIGREVNEIFEKAKPAIVRVRTKGHLLTLAGSGFFINDRGTVLTAAAILGNNPQASVEVDGKWLEAKIIGKDVRSGIALLQIVDGLTPFLTTSHSKKLKSGTAVMTIGFPRNLPSTPTWGLISGFDYRYLNRFFPTTHIRANVHISPGQVGGPLLDTQGEVVGLVVTAIDEGRSLYALPIEAVQKVVRDLQKEGTVHYGWVGVGVQPVSLANASSRGVQISYLFEKTPAFSSGLRIGDIVLQIDNRLIKTPADVIDASFFSHINRPMNITVLRKGHPQTFSFAVQERPQMMPGVTPLKPSNLHATPPLRPALQAPTSQVIPVRGSHP